MKSSAKYYGLAVGL